MKTEYRVCFASVECTVIPVQKNEFCDVCRMIENNHLDFLHARKPAATFLCAGTSPTDEELTRCNLKGEYFLLVTVQQCSIFDDLGMTVTTRNLNTKYTMVTPVLCQENE